MNSVYAAIAGVLFTLGLGLGSFGGYHFTADHYKKQLADIQAAQAKAVAQATQSAAATQQKQTTITQEIGNAYSNQVAAVQRYYASRLRLPAAGHGTDLPTPSQSASSPAPAASDAVPADQCAQTTLMLVNLQQWVKDQGLQ